MDQIIPNVAAAETAPLKENTDRWLQGAFTKKAEDPSLINAPISPQLVTVAPKSDPFDTWYTKQAEMTGINKDPKAPGHFYDYRRAYEAGVVPEKAEDGTYHWPSEFKDDMHPNRFVTLADGQILDTKTDNIVSDQSAIVNYFLDDKPVNQLIKAIETVESNGNPKARSKAGAIGEMQIIPKHAKDPGYGVKPWDRNTPGDQYRYAKDYVAAMYYKFGNINDALMAYNWGPSNVDKWISAGRPQDKIPREAKEYPFKVLTTAENILSRELSPAAQQTKGALNVREYP